MKAYHRTDHPHVIKQGGFRGGTGTYMTVNVYIGVWVSNVPLDANEGAFGEMLIEMETPHSRTRVCQRVEQTPQGVVSGLLIRSEALRNGDLSTYTQPG